MYGGYVPRARSDKSRGSASHAPHRGLGTSEGKDWSRPPTIPDDVVLEQTLELGQLVEPRDFDALRASEHFGNPTACCLTSSSG